VKDNISKIIFSNKFFWNKIFRIIFLESIFWNNFFRYNCLHPSGLANNATFRNSEGREFLCKSWVIAREFHEGPVGRHGRVLERRKRLDICLIGLNGDGGAGRASAGGREHVGRDVYIVIGRE
jgi:hypothetical protein